MKNLASNLLFLLLTYSLTVFTNTLAASSSTLEFSRSITTSNDAWLTISSHLKINTEGDIYAIDGINNNLQIDEAAKTNNLREVYLVDGFNNTLQTNNVQQTSVNNSNAPFIWTKFLTIDKKGNFFRGDRITSKGSDRLSTLDGINNKLKVSGNEASSQFDGINNLPAYISIDRGKLPFSSNWIKNLDLGETGRVYQSKKITAKDNENIYFQDGFNNEIQEEVSNGTGNIYFANGMNNLLQTASPSLFNKGKNGAIAEPDPEFLSLLENFAEGGNSNFPQGELPEDISKLFARGENNPLIDAFKNTEIDPEFLSLLEDFMKNGGKFDGNYNFPQSELVGGNSNFPQGELPEDISKLFTSGENNPWIDAFKNVDVDPEFLSLLEDYVKNGGKFDGDYNFPQGELPENIAELFTGGGKNPFLNLSNTNNNRGVNFLSGNTMNQLNRDNNLETAAVPEPSSLLGLLFLGFGLLLLKQKKRFVLRIKS